MEIAIIGSNWIVPRRIVLTDLRFKNVPDIYCAGRSNNADHPLPIAIVYIPSAGRSTVDRGKPVFCVIPLYVEMAAAQASKATQMAWEKAEVDTEAKKQIEGDWGETKRATCPECGTALDANTKFCPECGAKIQKVVFCAECGAKLQPGAKFCGECGHKAG